MSDKNNEVVDESPTIEGTIKHLNELIVKDLYIKIEQGIRENIEPHIKEMTTKTVEDICKGMETFLSKDIFTHQLNVSVLFQENKK